jgi:hypothetical protein
MSAGTPGPQWGSITDSFRVRRNFGAATPTVKVEQQKWRLTFSDEFEVGVPVELSRGLFPVAICGLKEKSNALLRTAAPSDEAMLLDRNARSNPLRNR